MSDEIARRDDTGGEVAQRSPQQTLLAQIRRDEFREQLAMALPPSVPPDRFIRAAATALLEKPEIADAEPTSIITALLRCAQLGLMPDGREAAINVYRTKVKDASGREVWIDKAQLLEMIHGYRKIAADYGWTLTARVVYAADEFEYEEGLQPRLRHVPARPGAERGDRVAVYALATKRGEQAVFRVLTPTDVARARKSAKTDKIWNEHTDRMWEKTAGKLLFKDLPRGSIDERVLRLIEARDADPADAAAALYGPQARETLTVDASTGEILPATTASHGRPEDDSAPVGEPAVAGEAAVPAAATPEQDDTDHIPFGNPPATQGRLTAVPTDDDVRIAAAFTVPRGNPPDHPSKPGAYGLTLAQIDADDDKADRWFAGALAQAPGFWPDDFAAALRLFVAAKRPHLIDRAA